MIRCLQYNANFQLKMVYFFKRSSYNKKRIWPFSRIYIGQENLVWPPRTYYLTQEEYLICKLQGKVE